LLYAIKHPSVGGPLPCRKPNGQSDTSADWLKALYSSGFSRVFSDLQIIIHFLNSHGVRSVPRYGVDSRLRLTTSTRYSFALRLYILSKRAERDAYLL
jgi:hypothetical protein